MAKNTKEIFRENLRKIIQIKSLTLSQAAADSEISLSFLNQLLSGKKAYSPETIDKICKGLKCSQEELFTDHSTNKPEKIVETAPALEISDAQFEALTEALKAKAHAMEIAKAAADKDQAPEVTEKQKLILESQAQLAKLNENQLKAVSSMINAIGAASSQITLDVVTTLPELTESQLGQIFKLMISYKQTAATFARREEVLAKRAAAAAAAAASPNVRKVR